MVPVSTAARMPPLAKKLAPWFLLGFFVWLIMSGTKGYTSSVIRHLDSRGSFTREFMENDIGGHIDSSGIAKLCSSKTWDDGLAFNCDNAKDGLAMARQYEIQCVRLAIEMGASILILPHIDKRKDTNFRITPRARAPPTGVPLEYMFDSEHLKQTLAAECPQMKVYSTISELADVPSLLQPLDFKITDVVKDLKDGVLTHPEEFSAKLRKYIDDKSPKDTRHTPLRVRLMTIPPLFPVYHDSTATAKAFGALIRIRPDIRRLAASALYKMSKQFSMDLSPHNGLNEKGFAGVHLRIERDHKDRKFPDYKTQSADALDYLSKARLSVAYVATGGPRSDVEDFTRRAEEKGITVVTKEMLLEGDELEQLSRLTYDQQALLDYEIMKRAARVVGRSQSFLSWDLAIVRSMAYGGGKTALQTWNVMNLFNGIKWQDRYTTLYGDMEMDRTARLETTWP